MGHIFITFINYRSNQINNVEARKNYNIKKPKKIKDPLRFSGEHCLYTGPLYEGIHADQAH